MRDSDPGAPRVLSSLVEAATEADTPHTLVSEGVLPQLTDVAAPLAERLTSGGALGLILVDAGALCEIERLYGPRPFRRAIRGLSQRLRNRLEREVGRDFTLTAGAMAEEQVLVFLHRPRADQEFYTDVLARLAHEVRGYASLMLKRVAYPYLTRPPEVPVGQSLVFQRAFQRPETQIRGLVAAAEDSARFEAERARRARLETLQRILIQETITSVYEPIVRLEDREPIGYEALARGPSGTGLETPAALFAVAQQGDLLFELDVLCRRRALHGAKGIDSDSLLFLNILPSSIRDPDFTELRIRRALDELGIGPRNLVLEISEREAISSFSLFCEAVDHIKRLGVRIALDDTGAGYSSLEAAMELSPDYLKIDMSLVRGIDEDPQRRELITSLQRLAANMGSKLIAEGIETEAEFEMLLELGVELGQGFLFGRGGPISKPEPGLE